MGNPKKKASTAYQVRVSGNALANIDETTGYIAFINNQPLNAIAVGDTIYKTIDRIGLSPYAFNECHELPTTNRIYRRAVCLSWLIIYKIVAVEITILGIIHKSRKPSEIKKMRKIK
jgi:plasmid stabilization system protein ParE